MSKSSLSSLLSLHKQTFIVCEITGIPLSISFPNCGIDFNYKSPFTKYNNILKVAQLPPEKIRSLPKVTLAGITLAILSHHSLLNRHDVSAVEANIYFQLLPSHLLISVIKFFTSTISQSTIEILPHFSLDSIQDKVEFSTRENLLENYIKACREIINPTPSNQVNIISTSLILPMDTPASKRMISILLSCQKNANHAEQIKKNLIEEDMARLSDTFDIVTKRKSLAEILQSKISAK
jgi:hypothetical protein